MNVKKSAWWSGNYQTADGVKLRLHRQDSRAVLDQMVALVEQEIGRCPKCYHRTESLDFTGQAPDGTLHFASWCPHCRQVWRTMLWPVPK